VYFDILSNKLQKLTDSQNSMQVEDDSMFTDTVLRMKIKMARACHEQNNFALALKILKETYMVRVDNHNKY